MNSVDILVEVDNREKKPVCLPETIRLWTGARTTRHLIHSNTVQLDAGDYRLAEYPTKVVIERKSGLDEIAKNVTQPDLTRFTAALDRLAGCCEHPVLLLEANLGDLLGTPKYSKAVAVFDRLMDLCLTRKISVLTMGRMHTQTARRKMGEAVVRILCSGAQ